MRLVIQRVKEASVTIGGVQKSAIGQGMMILVGICDEDTDEDIDYLCRKVVQMRIFPDSEGVMNLSISDLKLTHSHINALTHSPGILVVSQFTLMASTKKGNRPSYIHASKPDFAVPMYEKFVLKLQDLFGKEIQTGEFGADMQVALINDGPVTIIMDSHQREKF